MSDDIPPYASHADIERWMKDQPVDVLSRLPDCPETRAAARLIDEVVELAHTAREQHATR